MDLNDDDLVTYQSFETEEIEELVDKLDVNDKPDEKMEKSAYYFTTKFYNVTKIVKVAKDEFKDCNAFIIKGSNQNIYFFLILFINRLYFFSVNSVIRTFVSI